MLNVPTRQHSEFIAGLNDVPWKRVLREISLMLLVFGIFLAMTVNDWGAIPKNFLKLWFHFISR